MSTPKSKKSRRSRGKKRVGPWQGSLRMALVFAALIGLNLYIFVLKPKTSVRELLKTTELAKQGASASISTGPTAAAAPAAASPAIKPKPPAPDEEDARVVEATVHVGESIARVLQLEGVTVRDANDVIAALATVRQGRLEGTLAIRWDAEERLRGVELREGAAPTWRAERERDGWRGSRDDRAVQIRTVEVGGVVGASLFDAVKRAGESPLLATAIADVLAWDVGFQVDAQPTDRFKVIVEKRLAGGKLLRYGRVLALEYQGRAGAARAFWFQPSDGSEGGYYTEHGEALEKGLVRSPLKLYRVPPAFDKRRFHPVAHVERGAPGVDYGAPVGAPVWAVADGRVTAVGPRPGVGSIVVLAHGGGLETTYTHLGRLAHGLKPGQDVHQKQVIGYVGQVPAVPSHLHFAVRQQAAWVDPLKLKPARGAPLTGTRRVEFVDQIATRLSALAAIDTHDRASAALP